VDLKNCAYFPQRPALKFIPSPIMVHQLLHQAMMVQNPQIDAPRAFKELHDFEVTKSDLSKKKAPNKTGTQSNFVVLQSVSRLQSTGMEAAASQLSQLEIEAAGDHSENTSPFMKTHLSLGNGQI